jgi:hypothetical protein
MKLPRIALLLVLASLAHVGDAADMTPDRAGVERPNARNTGPRTPHTLTVRSGDIEVTKDGQVLEGFHLKDGQITVRARNVKIRNFRISGGDRIRYGIVATDPRVRNLVIEHGEIERVTNIAVYGHDFTARRLYLHHLGSDGIRPTGNVTVTESYIEKIGYPKAHADAVQMLVGSHVVFRNNTINIPFDDPDYMNSACFMIQVNKGPIDDILIEDNDLLGGDFCIRLTGNVTNMRVRNNRFHGGHEYGPFANDKFAELCGNVWADNGRLIKKNKRCD